ncbi:hypothetical protein Tco_1392499 [Tanacetum coccineum]
MSITNEQQQALDDALVPREQHLTIGSCNYRLSTKFKPKEPTFQVALDVLSLTPFYLAFLITASVLVIYMQEFWATFVDPSFKEDILTFMRELGYPGNIKLLSDVKVDTLPQPWRTFGTIINKCLSGKVKGIDTLRLFRAQILWGLYHQETVDYVYLLWEDLVFQIENKETRKNKSHTEQAPKPTTGKRVKATAKVAKSGKKKQLALGLETLSESSDEEDDDDDEGNIGNDEDDNDQDDDDNTDHDDDSEKTDLDNDGDEFVHPKFTTHDDEARQEAEVKEEDDFDPRVQTPSRAESTSDEDNDDEIHVNLEGQQQISSVSSGFLSNMLNPNPDLGIDSIFNVNTKSTSLVDVPVNTIIEPSFLATTTLHPSTNPLITHMQQTPDPTLTTIPSSLLQDLPNFGSLFGFDHKLKALEDNFLEFTQMNPFATAMSSIPEFLNLIDVGMKKIIKDQVKSQVKDQVSQILPRIEKLVNDQLESEVLIRSSKEANTSHVVAANLSELELKKILIDKMEANKSIDRLDIQKNLYKALVDAYEADKNILDTYGDTEKRSKSTGSSKEGPKSKTRSTDKSAYVEESVHTVDDLEQPAHQEFNTGFTKDQPAKETTQFPDWFQKPTRLPSPNREWNKTLPADHGLVQPWLSIMVQNEDPRESFNEMMDTPLDFSAFMMNRLKVDTLTPELLAGLTFELMKGSCKSLTELEYFLEEVYKATTEQLDWINLEGLYDKYALWGISHLGKKRQQFYAFSATWESAKDVYSKRKLTNLTVEERLAFNVSLRMFTKSVVIQRRVEDLQLGVESYQKKLNLTKPNTYRSDLKRCDAYSAYSIPRGFIYQNKDKKNRLMRIDELHKFSDGTLDDVRTALNDRLKGIRMQYLPQTIWR